MQRKFDKKRQPNRGFTLVELVIVVAILAILVGLLAPQYTKYVERSRKAADAENLEEMVKAFEVAVADQECEVPSGKYMITIAETSATTFEGPDTNGTATIPIENKKHATYGELYTAMCATLGDNWLKTTLKSANWTTGNSSLYSSIIASLEVGTDGSVSVDYTPSEMKEMASKSTTTTTTTKAEG